MIHITYMTPGSTPEKYRVLGPSAKVKGRSPAIWQCSESGSAQKMVYAVSELFCAANPLAGPRLLGGDNKPASSYMYAHSTHTGNDAPAEHLPVDGRVARHVD